MHQSVLTILAAAGVVTALSMTSVPANAQYAVCLPARGCVPATQASYNACYTLARQLGWRDSDNAPRGGLPRALDEFLYRCLQGRESRGSSYYRR